MMSRGGRVLSSWLSVSSAIVQAQDSKTTARTRTCSSTERKKSLDINNLNPHMVKLQYAIRGPLVIRAEEINKEIEKGVKKPFKGTIGANIGDAQAMGQKPITYFRQVLSCVVNPALLESNMLPPDVKTRASDLLEGCGGTVGVYTQAYGVERIRHHVAKFIEQRDGHAANWQDVCLTQGTTTGIKHCLQMFCNQYPLYSASLEEYGLGQVPYYLDEDKDWGIEISELERAYQEGSNTYAVRALVIINPGNPTGQVLTENNMKDILMFAEKHGLFVFADEVYQDNVYAPDCKFSSFKKVMTEMGPPCNGVELASFMSISKGYMGECGLRGGWMELMNLDPDVQANLYKTISATLCPNTIGQCIVDMVVRPPQPGDPSYDLWFKEKKTVLDSLKMRSRMCVETFNTMEGYKCNPVQGAMYAFPRITLPPKAVKAAAAMKLPADTFYASRLLEDTGICIVPGSGFGQRPGTYHFRTTILPQPEVLEEMLKNFRLFHQKFTKQYSCKAVPDI